jgi:hypothetical protein
MSEIIEDAEFMPGHFPSKAILRGGFTVQSGDAGAFDELFVRGADVHLEMLDDGTLWMHIEAGSHGIMMVFSAEKRGKMFVKLEQD